ncbi:MAG: hypothetical protein K2X03_16025 [Bryobacteraceae bacterium]|nr:hypothetical protein [Bryobacteraceae bacterium]
MDLLVSPETIRDLARQHGTPLYLLDPRYVVDALRGLTAGLMRFYPNVEATYSVKSNYLAGILRAVLAAGFRLEVVSRHELALAGSLGAGSGQLLFNGPGKTREDFAYCQRQGIDVNVDSLDELRLAASLGTRMRVGLRIAATLHNGSLSRFGLVESDFDEVRQLPVSIAGLHLHHSSRRDAQSYCDRLDRLREVAATLKIEPEYYDLGGGMASVPPPEVAARLPYPIDPPEQWTETLGRHAARVLGAGGPRLILEPGIGVLAGCLQYVTSITAVKRRPTGDIAICDGSLFDVNPLRSAIHPPCVLLERTGTGAVPLYGGTCMEIDQLGALAATPVPGDLAVVGNVGAYSVSLAPQFIVPPTPVYAVDTGELLRVRPALGEFLGAGR